MTALSESKRYFTVDEANARLPLVRAIVQDIVRLYEEVHERRERLARIRQIRGGELKDDSVYSDELRQAELELDKDIARLEAFAAELHELGAELKDPVIGLVDFLTQIDGRDAYLCWKLGEDEIQFWHDLNSGFRGRQSLLEGAVSGGGDELTGDGRQN
ncbi:MAG TPA: DUF2203 domain-containing protein [Planctomycetaceae bacterium]|nr:DUF2203 domain-containing protein [Planctomycetaceae bacterium]